MLMMLKKNEKRSAANSGLPHRTYYDQEHYQFIYVPYAIVENRNGFCVRMKKCVPMRTEVTLNANPMYRLARKLTSCRRMET